MVALPHACSVLVVSKLLHLGRRSGGTRLCILTLAYPIPTHAVILGTTDAYNYLQMQNVNADFVVTICTP